MQKTLPYRSGLPTLRRLCRVMCRVLVWSFPILDSYFADNEAFALALRALRLACQTFLAETEQLIEKGV